MIHIPVVSGTFPCLCWPEFAVISIQIFSYLILFWVCYMFIVVYKQAQYTHLYIYTLVVYLFWPSNFFHVIISHFDKYSEARSIGLVTENHPGIVDILCWWHGLVQSLSHNYNVILYKTSTHLVHRNTHMVNVMIHILSHTLCSNKNTKILKICNR